MNIKLENFKKLNFRLLIIFDFNLFTIKLNFFIKNIIFQIVYFIINLFL